MKIVCGSCGAKYSIADEKVQGKVFKIRCKKCSNVIVVKGDSQQAESQQQEASQDAAMSGAYGGTSGAAEWYVVIDGDQVGPISPEEIEAYYTSGQIGPDSFAWRDGLGDWVALSELDEFAHLTQQSGGAGDATAVVESPFNDGGAARQEEEEGFNEDATSVMPADDFRAQYEEKEAGAANAEAGFDDESQHGYDEGGFGGYDAGGSYDDGDYGDQQYADSNTGSGAYAADGGQSSYDGFGGDQSAFDNGGNYDAGDSYDADGSYGGAEFDSGSYDDGGYDAYADDDYADDSAENDGMFASFDSSADGADSGYDGFGGYDEPQEQESASDGAMQSANDMIGQRSENSVLFSLSSLDQVDSVSGADAGPGQGGGAAGGDQGDASNTEGSGLIDIQALASAHKAMKGGGGGGGGNGGPSAGPAGDAAEDPFGAGTMSMPALMPMGSHKSNKGLIIGLSIGGVVLLGALGAVGYMFMNRDDGQQEQKVVYVEKENEDTEAADGAKAGDSDDDKAKEEAAAAANAVDGEGSDEESDSEGSDNETAEKDDENSDDSAKDDSDGSSSSKTASASSSSSSSSNKSSKSSSSSSKSRSSSRSSSSSSSSRSKSNDDDISSLIDGVGKRAQNSGGSGGSAAPKETVPENLSRSQVGGTVKKWKSRVESCYRTDNKNKMAGKVYIKFTIQPSGSIGSASVTTGKFKGTDVGRCMEQKVKRMKFPKSQNSLTINYLFRLG